MIDHKSFRMWRIIGPALVLGLIAAAPAGARDVVRAPEHGGPGLTVLPEDNRPPIGPSAQERRLSDPGPWVAPEAADKTDTIGGDDVILVEGQSVSYGCLDIGDNGDIYALANVQETGVSSRIEVYRSDDGGATFDLWAVHEAAAGHYYLYPDMQVVEGAVDVVMVVYEHLSGGGLGDIELVSAPLGGATGSFGTPVAIMTDPDTHFHYPRFDTDVSGYSSFYVYVVAAGTDDTGVDIWFARSTNQGGAFESPYMIAELLVDDRTYSYPDISYGFGGHLHVVWYFSSDTDAFDKSVRYRRASAFADAGLADWDYWDTLTSTSDGFDDTYPMVHGGRASEDVVIAYARIGLDGIFEDSRLFVSDNLGLSFGSPLLLPADIGMPGDFAEDVDSGLWAMAGLFFANYGVITANVSDLTDWSGEQHFNDDFGSTYWWYRPDVALHPTRSSPLAVVWTRASSSETPDRVYFDAEWHADPGYPNVEPGYPLGLWAPPISPPALVDVDGDPELEIVFTDQLRQIQVVNPDGSNVPGWPVDVGVDLSDGPVAIGDLDGDGEPILVVGGTDGNAYAFDPQGNLLPGWPSAITPPGHDVYVSIGAVGPPYPRSVVCAGANYVTLRNRRGVAPPNTVGWSVGTGSIVGPACIGDIDDDGTAEIVAGVGDRVCAFEKGAPSLQFNIGLSSVLSDAPTLGDLDLDGDLEILCPTAGGVLYALGHTGGLLGGNFPYDTGNAGALTSAAIAQFRGGSEPDIAFAHSEWVVHACTTTARSYRATQPRRPISGSSTARRSWRRSTACPAT